MRLLLIAAGLVAVVFSQLSAVDDLTLFGASDERSGPLGLGPEWIARVPDVAGGLGLSAALCGALVLRWPDRTVAAIVAAALALGCAFVVWWLLAPPSAVRSDGLETFAYPVSMWIASAALAVAAAAAAALVRPRAAAKPRSPR
ncbi:hypothetical protein DVA67_026950 [Solirubrobacter sp. CPCC 204708]|uniref:Uncharacterized protein n=1 Tax=Solirubrobacter deserti TaxID=2282478 RepID=A0ABT4RGF4_9ACTN|nr:hypothetical protein [Solirubrobacter deserti]MBE2319636.1 hypothetical protein [Solirubrobacter deserti]MDA0137625.1 hypothetical protein [Solirubrobacter deserti]